MGEFTNKGVGNAALTTGIIGTAGWALNGGLSNLFGGMGGNCNGTNAPINRYEMGLLQENAALKTEVEMHKAEIYVDNKLEVYNDRVECRLRGIEGRLAEQAVWNATQTGTLSCMAQQIAALNNLTKLVVPADSVCPQPMPQYNSWTAPTTT